MENDPTFEKRESEKKAMHNPFLNRQSLRDKHFNALASKHVVDGLVPSVQKNGFVSRTLRTVTLGKKMAYE